MLFDSEEIHKLIADSAVRENEHDFEDELFEVLAQANTQRVLQLQGLFLLWSTREEWMATNFPGHHEDYRLFVSSENNQAFVSLPNTEEALSGMIPSDLSQTPADGTTLLDVTAIFAESTKDFARRVMKELSLGLLSLLVRKADGTFPVARTRAGAVRWLLKWQRYEDS